MMLPHRAVPLTISVGSGPETDPDPTEIDRSGQSGTDA